MSSLFARYLAGNHEEVWRELRSQWNSYGEIARTDGPWERSYTIDREDAEAVFRETFDRVKRNADRLITRLRDLGYAFETEAGRYGPAHAPLLNCTGDADRIEASLRDKFSALPAFADELSPFPASLYWFCQKVGHLDLRQRFSPVLEVNQADWRDQLSQLEPATPNEEAMKTWGDILSKALPKFSEEEIKRHRQLIEADRENMLNTRDPVIDRLGDWDPLVIGTAGLASELAEPEIEVAPISGGGLAVIAEIAPSFEHKANISGAQNLEIRLPNRDPDPIIYAEGWQLPLTTYLRRIFKRGGFFGVPRPLGSSKIKLAEVEPGIFLPDHPIFKTLSEGMEAF